MINHKKIEKNIYNCLIKNGQYNVNSIKMYIFVRVDEYVEFNLKVL